MVKLMLLRHAKSDWADGSLSDSDRPLNPRGRRTAPKVARWMHQHAAMPDRILCSTAQRARETLDRMLEHWTEEKETPHKQPDVLYLSQLYLASPQIILETAIEHAPGSQALLVVGHNPGMEMLATKLSNRACAMPTAALAIFQSEPDWPADWWDNQCWTTQGLIVQER